MTQTMEEARELQQVQSHVMGEFKMIVTLREGSDAISSVVWKRNAIQCFAAKVLKHSLSLSSFSF